MKYAKGPKLQELLAESTGNPVHRAKKFGDLITADHKVLGEDCMQSWYKIWLLNGCSHIRTKPNLPRRPRRT